ncbi:ThiF family adenylyltransferase [Aliarcobacter butzleri]|uniref:ThiF family adenylyltransferase n=1 Tax=Aliarcobacter butzleri TaxID=28197 RepID=UPI00263F529F|nr:ThiF family adenylyltransferase [Aliarcobacter butzleri]MDN5043793.1 ThiF family adenylyltransferase [Aliarcobacter butzleri]
MEEEVFNLSNIFNFDNVEFKNKIIYVNKLPIGIIQPSSIFGISKENYYISGTNGIYSIDKKSSAEEIIRNLINSGSIVFGSSEEIIEETINILKKPMLSRTSSYLLSILKNCDEFIKVIEKIENAKIAIVGCGGIGSLSAMTLAGSGIKNILLIDGDIIEESNLNRQFFWNRDDIGQKKVVVLSREIEKRYTKCNCTYIDLMTKIEDILKIIEETDLVVLSADEPIGISSIIEQKIKQLKSNTSIIHSGYVGSNLGISLYNKNNDFLENNLEQIDWIRHSDFIAPSYGASNVELAGVLSFLAISKIAGLKIIDNFKIIWDSRNFPRKYVYKD